MKKRKGSAAYLCLVFCILPWIVAFISCKNQENSFTLKSLYFNLHGESKHFAHIKDAPKFYFWKGWLYAYKGWLKGHTISHQAIDREAIIRFNTSGAEDRKLLFNIQNPHYSTNHQKLPINLYLNKYFLQQIEIKDHHSYSVFLPGSKLKHGENFLKFVVSKEFYKNRKFDFNHPTGLFIIQNVHLMGTFFPEKVIFEYTDRHGKQTFLQPSNSHFSVAVNTEESKTLRFKFRSKKIKKNVNSKMTIFSMSQNRVRKIVKKVDILDDSYHKGSLDLQNLEGKHLTMEFEFTSECRRAFLIWDEIKIIVKKVTPKPKPLNEFFKFKPHIFFIILDAARFDTINRRIFNKLTTPNIKHFSKTAYQFLNYYANAPHTSPSVVTMFTGLLPETHSIRSFSHPLPDNLTTLPEHLKAIGYITTGFIGNYVLKLCKIDSVFDTSYIIKPTGISNSTMDIETTKEVIQNLDYSRPNFVYIHFLPPHKPYNPPLPFKNVFVKTRNDEAAAGKMEKTMERFQVFENKGYIDYSYKTYLNNLLYGDYLVGEILKTIKEKKLFDSAMIIVASDHGEAFAEHGKFTHSTTNYQEMIHIPMFIKLPFQTTRDIIKESYSHLDLLITLASILPIKKNDYWQGRVILFKQIESKERGIPNIIYSRAAGTDINSAIIYGRHKYIFYSGRDELYDITKDFFEKNNMAQENEYLTLYLRQELFLKFHESMDLQKKLGIFPRVKSNTTHKQRQELKTLGYL